MPTVAPFIGFTRISDQLRRLYATGCSLEPSTVLTDVRDGQARTRHIHSGAETSRAFDAIVAVAHGRPALELLPACERRGIRVLTAGDARAPRTALHAFREGDEIGASA